MRRAEPLAVLLLAGVPALFAPAAAAAPLFVEVSAATGLDFRHWNGMTGQLDLPEIFGPGVALFDADGDGDLDVLALQGATLDTAAGPPLEPPPTKKGARFFRNQLIPRGELSFVDDTEKSGLRIDGYSMGLTTGDVDNDGDVDLFVSHLGRSQLWINTGDGAFAEQAAARGLAEPAELVAARRLWGTSASFFDADSDGELDLFVAHYLAYPRAAKSCNERGTPDYCSPANFAPLPDRFYRNRGNGQFEEATLPAGFGRVDGPGLGTVFTDFDDDGHLDLYVANDGTENQLWHNRGNGTFEDLAPLAGVAVDMNGQPEGSMGVDAGDVDGDGQEDLIAVPLDTETKSLYRNTGAGYYEEITLAAGLARLGFTSFGALFFDFDLDGDLDLFVVNGAVHRIAEQAAAGALLPLAQRKQLFENLGAGRFREIDATTGGENLGLPEVSRGLATGDIDNDGDPDLLIGNNAGPLRLLRNQTPRQAWLGLEVLSRGRHALGAKVRVEAGGQLLWRRVRTDGSYLSARDPRLQIGLPADVKPPIVVRVDWPDRLAGEPIAEVFEVNEIGRYVKLERGRGRKAPELAKTGPAPRQAPVPVAPPRVESPPPLESLPQAPRPSTDLSTLPDLPSLEGFEPKVREQLQRARDAAWAVPHDAEAWALLAELSHAYHLASTPALYQRAQALAPASFRPFYLGGLFALEKEDFAAAARQLTAAAAREPNDPLVNYRLAELAFARGELAAAAASLDTLLAQNPGFAPGQALRARVAAQQGDLPKAAESYRRALHLQPAANHLQAALADVYRRLGQPEQAQAALARRGDGLLSIEDPFLLAVESRLLSAQHFQEVGAQALRSGQPEAAIAALKRATELAPDDLDLRSNLGAALYLTGAKNLARQELEAVLRQDPRRQQPLLHLAILHAESGEEDKAITLYRRLLDVEPDHGDALINLANLHRRRGEPATAAALYRRAIRLDPARSELRVALIRSLFSAGEPPAALAEAETAQRDLPADPNVQEVLIRLLAAGPPETRDGARALTLARETFERSATFPVVEALAMACAAAGRFEEAIVWQQKAIEVVEAAGRLADYPRLGVNLELYRRGQAAAAPW